MANKYETDDPRYHDRFAACMELLKMWRNLTEGHTREGTAMHNLAQLTVDFLDNDGVCDLPTDGDVAKT